MVDVVIVGHVTLDQTPGGVRPGGAAYYATITVVGSLSRSMSTNHTGRHRACWRMPVTSASRCSRNQVLSCSVVRSTFSLA